jgi:hypothetical protein
VGVALLLCVRSVLRRESVKTERLRGLVASAKMGPKYATHHSSGATEHAVVAKAMTNCQRKGLLNA